MSALTSSPHCILLLALGTAAMFGSALSTPSAGSSIISALQTNQANDNVPSRWLSSVNATTALSDAVANVPLHVAESSAASDVRTDSTASLEGAPPLRCTGICDTDAQAVDDSTNFWKDGGYDEASNGDVPDLPPVPTDAAAVGSTSLHNLRVAQSTVVDEARTNSDKTVEQALAIEGKLI